MARIWKDNDLYAFKISFEFTHHRLHSQLWTVFFENKATWTVRMIKLECYLHIRDWFFVLTSCINFIRLLVYNNLWSLSITWTMWKISSGWLTIDSEVGSMSCNLQGRCRGNLILRLTIFGIIPILMNPETKCSAFLPFKIYYCFCSCVWLFAALE